MYRVFVTMCWQWATLAVVVKRDKPSTRPSVYCWHVHCRRVTIKRPTTVIVYSTQRPWTCRGRGEIFFSPEIETKFQRKALQVAYTYFGYTLISNPNSNPLIPVYSNWLARRQHKTATFMFQSEVSADRTWPSVSVLLVWTSELNLHRLVVQWFLDQLNTYSSTRYKGGWGIRWDMAVSAVSSQKVSILLPSYKLRR